MATVILVRHGRSTANTEGVLAGRTAGVRLDETGEEQARRVGERMGPVPLARLVTSPLDRCRQTARAIASAQGGELRPVGERRLTECDYGDWQGRAIKELARERLWTVVQHQPSAAVFPAGESLRDVQDRAVGAVRRHDRAVEEEHGPDAVWAAVSHGDVIKAVLADALGSHLDHFQRIHVDPGSVSIVRYTESRPFVLGLNTHAGDLGWLAPPPRRRRRRRNDDAEVGGGSGPARRGGRS
jgi:probable phosphomutase (TIGR03848 family)